MNIVERLRSWAQNEEMVDGSFLEHGRVCDEAADAIELLEGIIHALFDEELLDSEQYEIASQIKAKREAAMTKSNRCPECAADLVSPDEKKRGLCNSCEIVRLRAVLIRVREAHKEGMERTQCMCDICKVAREGR